MEADEQGYVDLTRPNRKKQDPLKAFENKFNLEYAKHFWKTGFRGNFNEDLYKALMRIKYN